MASASRRLMLQLTLIFVAYLSGVAFAANSVKYSYSGNDVRYGDRLHVLSSRRSEGGVTNERTIPARRQLERLTGSSNDQGSIYMLESASGAAAGTTIMDNDEVYVEIFKLSKDPRQFWKFQRQEDVEPEFLLTRMPNERTLFKVVARPVPLIYPPVYNYALVSCPGSSCSGLSRYAEGEVNYIQLGADNTSGDLHVQFQPCELPVCNPRIKSISADT